MVLHFLAWQSVLAAVILWMLAKDRKVLKELDYVLLLTFVCFFIFVGNMKRIDAVNIRLMELIQGRELVTGIAASQIISNVPAAILLSGFTDRYKTLLAAVNLGGLGTLIASLASLISYKFFARSYPGKKGGIFWSLHSGILFFDPIDGTCSVIKLTRQYPAMHRNTSRDTAV